ncbi:MAG: metallophosphoesterase [Desulfovibrionaceae bacterium]|nr:metallophosphoesterase [Desulfovibrionaceae bacterium]
MIDSSFSFAVAGDSRSNVPPPADPVNTQVLNEVTASIDKLSPDLMLFLGDMSVAGNIPVGGTNSTTGTYIVGGTDHYTYNDWLATMRNPATGLSPSVPLYLAIGNHELYDAGYGGTSGDPAQYLNYSAQTAYQGFIESNKSLNPATFMPNISSLDNGGYKDLSYSFTSPDKRSLFVVLDGFYNDGTSPHLGEGEGNGWFDQTQLAYLDYALQTNNATTKFVFMHNPPFIPGDDGQPNPNISQGPSQTELWNIIDADHVDAVFTGHQHLYARTVVDPSFNAINPGLTAANSIPLVIAGSSGAPLVTTSNTPSLANVPPNWCVNSNYDYSLVNVDNNTGKVEIDSYCDNGTGAFSLSDKINTPLLGGYGLS